MRWRASGGSAGILQWARGGEGPTPDPRPGAPPVRPPPRPRSRLEARRRRYRLTRQGRGVGEVREDPAHLNPPQPSERDSPWRRSPRPGGHAALQSAPLSRHSGSGAGTATRRRPGLARRVPRRCCGSAPSFRSIRPSLPGAVVASGLALPHGWSSWWRTGATVVLAELALALPEIPASLALDCPRGLGTRVATVNSFGTHAGAEPRGPSAATELTEGARFCLPTKEKGRQRKFY